MKKMKKEKVITLDLTGCENWWELHERIRIAFDFPKWYGKNWSAFWDLLRTDCDANKITVIGESTLPDKFKPDLEHLHKILDRALKDRERTGWKFSYEIKN